jgi:hypothetical protein
MSKENREPASSDKSVAILLIEHQRLSNLYLHNVEIGEKRTTAYLTIVSIGTALLVGISQRGVAEGFLLWTSFGLVMGAFMFGLLTFQRLLERRIRAIEYLRAINRIHRFFVLKDPTIRDYFYWSAYDDVPPFIARGTTMAGLRDLVAAFNSLFAGVAVGGIILIRQPPNQPHTFTLAIAIGSILFVFILLLHHLYERRVLGKIEKEAAEGAKFPRENEQDDPNKSLIQKR